MEAATGEYIPYHDAFGQFWQLNISRLHQPSNAWLQQLSLSELKQLADGFWPECPLCMRVPGHQPQDDHHVEEGRIYCVNCQTQLVDVFAARCLYYRKLAQSSPQEAAQEQQHKVRHTQQQRQQQQQRDLKQQQPMHDLQQQLQHDPGTQQLQDHEQLQQHSLGLGAGTPAGVPPLVLEQPGACPNQEISQEVDGLAHSQAPARQKQGCDADDIRREIRRLKQELAVRVQQQSRAAGDNSQPNGPAQPRQLQPRPTVIRGVIRPKTNNVPADQYQASRSASASRRRNSKPRVQQVRLVPKRGTQPAQKAQGSEAPGIPLAGPHTAAAAASAAADLPEPLASTTVGTESMAPFGNPVDIDMSDIAESAAEDP